jgi:hypothetical protein
MSWAASRIARFLWKGMLWLMRRPWMKRLQKASFHLVPPSRRDGAMASLRAQNRWARHFGLRILTFSMNIFLGTVLVTSMYVSAVYLQSEGLFTPPEQAVQMLSAHN